MPRQTIDELEKRVSTLERQVADLLANGTGPGKKDWRRTIGMFTGDEAMQRIFAAGQAWRERERRRALGRGAKRRRVKS